MVYVQEFKTMSTCEGIQKKSMSHVRRQDNVTCDIIQVKVTCEGIHKQACHM